MSSGIGGSCMVGLLLLAAAARAGGPFPPELVELGPPPAEPLFSGGGPDAWDRELLERGWIVRRGDRWSLWYTGSNPDRDPIRRLGLATSVNGLNWSRSTANPLVPDAWVEDVCVVRDAGRYMMLAEGERDIAQSLVSLDRVHCNRCGSLAIHRAAGGPIPDGPRGTPAVRLERGIWHLFYGRMDRGVWLATSRDGHVFTNVGEDSVLTCGPEPYDRHAIAVDQIVRHAGQYYAFYHASPREDRATWQTCLATSTDLVHWTKYAANPLLPVDPVAPKRSSATLAHDGERFCLYTTHPDVRVRLGIHVQTARR
jgi:hypothetical protein